MALFYSASTPGFFDDAIHAHLPPDAVRISAARHAELLAAQAGGAMIVAGERGRPRIHRDPPSLADRRAAAIRRVKREAARRIEAISPPWRQLNDLREPGDAGAARFAAIDAVRAASGAIEAAIATLGADALEPLDIAAHPLWPETARA
ncbi:MAG: hypothetical protein WAO77_08570 [Sphingobium sp.]|uniref:hypothetical protein n=1 Tax=Sphingobium sp. TaxID=1912891 RepID=UPI003BAF1CFE